MVENGVVEEEERTAAAGGVVVFYSDADKVELISAAMNQVAEVISGTDKASTIKQEAKF